MMEKFTMTKAILLLHTTHAKLSHEENIFDSSSPLRALHLYKLAGSLNKHIQSEQVESTPVNSTYKETDYRMMAAGLDDFDYDDDSEAYEVGQSEQEPIDSVVELEDSDEELTPTDAYIYPSTSELELDFDEDLAGTDYDEDMPSLSRQSSRDLTESDEDSDHEEIATVETVRTFLLAQPITIPVKSGSCGAASISKPSMHQLMVHA